MAVNRYRRITDLFVRGKSVTLPGDNGYLWVQAINSFERDECISDAQVSRSRLILALRESGDERMKVKARLAERGLDSMIEDLATVRAEGKLGDFTDQMRDDPDWKERMEIILKTDYESTSKPLTEEEVLLMAKVNAAVMEELQKRQKDEHDFLVRSLGRMAEDDFIDEWVEEWLDRRGGILAQGEYQLTEIWFATRFCEAQPKEDGELDHSKCDGHRERLFQTKNDARSAPDELQTLLRDALLDLNIEGRDPKDSGSDPNSSGSSPTPSEVEASTPSTPDAAPSTDPGT